MRRKTVTAGLASVILSIFALSGCTAPGEGEKAEAGYNNARPVIAALKQYRDKHNQYPPTLRELVPDDLAESAWKTPDGKSVGEFFEYSLSPTSYQLKFSYTGPGMNRCVYTPEAAKWECAGYH